MNRSVESEARKALMRLRRALEKTQHELEAVAAALRDAEGEDFPHADFDAAIANIHAVETFVDEQAERIEEKMLSSGGLEPGRIRRG
jgi:hypothetical protein